MLSLVPDGSQSYSEVEKFKLFWIGHSRFQAPYRVVAFKGRAESLILIYLFQLANSFSNNRIRICVIELEVSEKTIAKKTGVSPRAVNYALATLVAAGCIRIVRRRDYATRSYKTSIHLLLHSKTGQPMYTTGGDDVYGICQTNFEQPYVTLLTKSSLEILTQMTPAGRAVYIAAMALGSVRVSTAFGITKEDWQKESLLGRNAFGRGKLECEKKGLLSYSKKYVLTLNDPLTGKPNARSAHIRVEHDNPVWRFDLKSVTPQVWKSLIERLMRREFYVDHSGWTVAGKDVNCPFCKKARGFSINYVKSGFKCHKCNVFGGLGQLVAKVLRVKMKSAKKYIAQQMPQKPETQPEQIAI